MMSGMKAANKIASKAAWKNPAMSYDEAQAAAHEGLWMAAMRFDPSNGAKFVTYATRRIAGQINDYLRVLNGRHGQKDIGKVRLDHVVSGEHDQREQNGYSLLPQPDTTAARLDAEDLWRVAMRGMNKKERLIVIMHSRLGETMKTVGRHLGLSESRVSQMHSALHEKMRANLIRNESKVI